MKIKNKMKKQLMGLLSVVMVFSLTSQNILYAMGETEKEPTPAYTNEYSDENVKINVHAEGNVLPENAILKVTPLEKKEITSDMDESLKSETEKVNTLYEQTSEKLEAQSKENENTLEGFLAYDISFIVDGKEVEPNGKVDVSMQFVNATKPEGVSDDSVVNVKHLKESADQIAIEDITDNSEINIAENCAVEKINLTSDSFSVFTITWTRKDGKGESEDKLKIKIVDQKDNEIDLGSDFNFDITSNNEIKIENIAEKLKNEANGKLDDYIFVKEAYVKVQKDNGYEKKTFNKLVKWDYEGGYKPTGGYQAKNGDIQYNINTWEIENDGNRYAYFVFSEKPNYTEIKTIDSTSKGISMKMINWDGKAFEGAAWTSSGNIHQGILKSKLNEEGYPEFNENNQGELPKKGSLKEKFDNAKEVNNLFLESIYKTDGYFYYDSGENAAMLNTETNKFKVIEELVTPKNETGFFYKRGNFLPYAKFETGKLSVNKNLYDSSGNKLDENNPKFGVDLYMPDNGTADKDKYYFGMELETDFIQAEKGIYKNNKMRYEFTGDDDLWVYIDGVLVLDLGGCHDARSGYIDFSTGVVGYESSKNNYTETSLYEIYSKAGIAKNYDWQTIDGKKVFTDFSSHNMKMWYMERGGGASNLKIKFNLPVIPKDQIQVKKELQPETNPLVYGNVNFGFKLYLEKTAGTNNYELVTNLNGLDAKKIDSDGQTESNLTINENGIFYLKPEETATFSNIEKNRKYYVEEVDVQSDEFDQVFVNGVSVTDKYDDESTNTQYTAKSTEDTVARRPLVTFKNSCSAKNKRTLSIEKTMKLGQTSDDPFKILVKIENENGELTPYIGNYSLFNNGQSQGEVLNTNNGYIDLKVNQKVCIYNILSDTKFKVEEVDKDTKYGVEKYTVTDAKDILSENYASGSIELGKNASVKIENRIASIGTLEFTKTDSNTNKGLQYATFGLYSDKNCSEENMISKSTSDEDGKVKFDISALADKQTVYLKEISSPFGYKLNETVYKVKVSSTDDEGTQIKTATISTDTENSISKIPNTPVKSNGKTNVTVRKDWSNIPESEQVEITVKLYGNDKFVDSAKLNSNNNWTYTWNDLPGDTKYRVEEEVPDGFNEEYETESSIITNDNFQSITPNKDTYFELGSNGVIVIYSGSEWYVWTTTQLDDNQKASMISQLKKSIKKGQEISLKNTKFGAGNTSFSFKTETNITFKYSDGKLKLDFGNPKAWSFFYMGNYTENVTLKVKNDINTNKKINIPVEKIWDDNNSPTRPTSVEVQLYKEINNNISKVDELTMTLNESNDWNGVFENLPYWDETTKTKINYTVKESKIGDVDVVDDNAVTNGYTHIVTKDGDKFIITNYLSLGSLTINKEIVESKVNPNDGDPIFTFRIENEDKSIVLYRTIRLNSENLKGSILISDLPVGKYTVTELDTLRYTCISANPIADVVVNSDGAEVDFKNKITYDENFSHTDVIENSFKVGEDGKVTVTKQTVPGNDLATSTFNAKSTLNQILQGVLAGLN